MQRDILKAAESSRSFCRHACDRYCVEHATANDPNSAGPFGDQHIAVRKEGECPGMDKSPGHDCDPDLVLLRGIQHERAFTQGRRGEAERGLLRFDHEERSQQQRCREPNRGTSKNARESLWEHNQRLHLRSQFTRSERWLLPCEIAVRNCCPGAAFSAPSAGAPACPDLCRTEQPAVSAFLLTPVYEPLGGCPPWRSCLRGRHTHTPVPGLRQREIP